MPATEQLLKRDRRAGFSPACVETLGLDPPVMCVIAVHDEDPDSLPSATGSSAPLRPMRIP